MDNGNFYVLGLAGHMGAGKSTFCRLLSENTDIPIVVMKFAAPLYQMQEALYEIISPVFTREESFVKDRKLLQWLGTEWGRECLYENIWTDLWISRVNEVREAMSGKPVIIIADDVRFPNEAEAVRSFNGMVLKIHNHRGVTGGIRNHISEKALGNNSYDYDIYNNGTLKELDLEVERFLINTGLPLKKGA